MNEDQNKVDPMWDNGWQSGYNSRQQEVDGLKAECDRLKERLVAGQKAREMQEKRHTEERDDLKAELDKHHEAFNKTGYKLCNDCGTVYKSEGRCPECFS